MAGAERAERGIKAEVMGPVKQEGFGAGNSLALGLSFEVTGTSSLLTGSESRGDN